MYNEIYLASASPRRQELLRQIGVTFHQLTADIDESPLLHEAAADYVKRLAITKAEAIVQSASYQMPIPVLGADTIVVSDGQLLGKPCNQQQAQAMLKSLSGKTHQVLTCVALLTKQQQRHRLSVSEVTFATLGESQITQYCASGEPLDKAGSYAIQGMAASFITHMSGSYTGVVGLPLYETSLLLDEMNVIYSLSNP